MNTNKEIKVVFTDKGKDFKDIIVQILINRARQL